MLGDHNDHVSATGSLLEEEAAATTLASSSVPTTTSTSTTIIPTTAPNNVTATEFDIVKATQYGIHARCEALLNEGFDVNQRDGENITLLHWASINCRMDIVKLFVLRGAIVDAVGGELLSTPLHWATRQGHLNVVVFLMGHGADPTLRDGEGCSAIHLAAQFGYTSIVAYLLAKGINPDIQDKNGMTPLMWAACRTHSPDPGRLILTFGASLSIQDRIKRNTVMHWAIQSKNATVFLLLVNANASLDIPNEAGETAYSLLKHMNHFDWISKKAVDNALGKGKGDGSKRGLFSGDSRQDEVLKTWLTRALPFIVMYFIGFIFAASIELMWKLLLLLLVYLAFRAAGKIVCDDKFMSVFPICVYLATKFWMYVVWFLYIAPEIPIWASLFFILSSVVLWYNFLMAWRGDPGVIKMSGEERHATIITLAEENGFDPKHFCTTCLVRRPLRSKHCSVCNRCVARYDHHCPWLSNCVGWKNHKYFIGYLASLVFMCGVYVWGCVMLWDTVLGVDWTLIEVVRYQPWVNFMMAQAIIHGCWVFVLLTCQLYQILWLGLTTNERLNWTRYTYFGGIGGHHGHNSHPKPKQHNLKVFNRGVGQNFVDFFEIGVISYMRPNKIDWMRAWATSPQFSNNESDNEDDDSSSRLLSSDKNPLLRHNKDRDNYQYV